jgi:hypothetical protein
MWRPICNSSLLAKPWRNYPAESFEIIAKLENSPSGVGDF